MATTYKNGAYSKDINIQSHYAKTIQTHVGVSIAASSYGNSAWLECDGYSSIGLTLTNDAATATAIDVDWSHDGITAQGKDLNAVPSANTLQRAGMVDVKAKYFRLVAKNNDSAAAHVMSVWAYLKA